jgi:hypothetical protein
MITCCDAYGNSYDDQTGIAIPGSGTNPLGSDVYTNPSGASVNDSGSGSALDSILKDLTSLGGVAIASSLGPKNSGYATNYGVNPLTGRPYTATSVMASGSGMTLLILAVLVVVGFLLFKKL